MRRNSFLKKFIDSPYFSSFVSVSAGIGIVLLCLFGFSYLLTKIDANNAIKSVMSAFSLCLGAFFGGYICSKRKRSKGLINGLFCAIGIYIAIFCIGFVILKLTISANLFGKLILACILGAAGGICGVNSRYNFKAAKPKKNRFGT